MKKYLTLLAIAALTVNTVPALANGSPTPAEKRTVMAILGQQVDRYTIRELQLNEIQYIQLKELNAKYLQDVEVMETALMNNAALLEVRSQDLNNRYFNELSSILTPAQISNYVSKHVVAKSK